MTAPLVTRTSAALCRWRWEVSRERVGDDHPATRAWFGRFVGMGRGRALTPRAGAAAWRAYNRAAVQPGYLNRSYRRHLQPDLPDLPTGGTLFPR